ncbi:MAG: rnhA operon protein [Halobacteriales archaeon]|nr:rnhA operon protein [Halobacteriales archaeon]
MTEERPDWVNETARLTRVALSDDDEMREEARTRRDEIAGERGYEARLRDDGVLVLHPAEWLDNDGVVDLEAFDADEAYEVPLDGEGYGEARSSNDTLLDGFEEMDGTEEDDVFNARAFAEFCENHHATAVENVSEEHVREFLEDYYVRNVWASDEAEERVEESLRLLLREAERDDLLYATK